MLPLTLSMEITMSPMQYTPTIDPDRVVHHVSTTRPIAKKPYPCSCCGQLILKGQKHYKNVFKIGKDRKIKHERAHLVCPGWE